MIHYVASIIPDHNPVINRDPHSNQAGNYRALFVAKSISKKILIISLGQGYKSGIFKSVLHVIDQNISILYLPLINIFLKGKSISKLFYSFFLFNYLFSNAKKNDLVILYNCNILQVLPVVLGKIFNNYRLFLHIEEVYSFERIAIRKFAEKIAVKYSDGSIMVNNEIANYLNYKKPFLTNCGYSTFKEQYNKLLINQDKPQILYSGRLDYFGGLEVLLDAIQYINNPCNLIICGIGENKYEKMVKEFINKNKNVNFEYVGFLSNQQYYSLLINTKIGLNPIRTKHIFSTLSFPSKTLQYLEYGCMLVTPDIKYIQSLNELQEFIFYYKNDSPLELAKAIDNALMCKKDKSLLIEKMKNHFQIEKQRINTFFSKFA